MQALGTKTVCFLGIFSLLSTLGHGPTYVIAGIDKPGHDPLYFYRGNSNGARPPRRRPGLPTIYEEGSPPPEDGRAEVARNPHHRGRGPRPLTPFRFHHEGFHSEFSCVTKCIAAPPPAPQVVYVAQVLPPNPNGGNFLGAVNRGMRRLQIRRRG
uniref:Basic tail secreted protein n=1 Tax=Rhipicephalus appendiculatus TaxID=34631 RepID=A0A131YFN6_RHIAP